MLLARRRNGGGRPGSNGRSWRRNLGHDPVQCVAAEQMGPVREHQTKCFAGVYFCSLARSKGHGLYSEPVRRRHQALSGRARSFVQIWVGFRARPRDSFSIAALTNLVVVQVKGRALSSRSSAGALATPSGRPLTGRRLPQHAATAGTCRKMRTVREDGRGCGCERATGQDFGTTFAAPRSSGRGPGTLKVRTAILLTVTHFVRTRGPRKLRFGSSRTNSRRWCQRRKLRVFRSRTCVR